MAKRLDITRRDFLNGIALGTAASGLISPLELFAAGLPESYYPPLKTGMRGSHPGSFEVAHSVAWAGQKYPRPGALTDDVYDLVVVGGGISGLSAAHFYRQRAGEKKKVLILDNHDDFGGHAKRNEFKVDGKTLIGYGGSQSIDTPASYSEVAKQLLVDVGIDAERFYDYFDRDFFTDRKLGRAIYFNADAYGKNVVAPNLFGWGATGAEDLEKVVAQYPITDDSKAALLRLLSDETDYRPDLSRDEKVCFLRDISYTRFLQEYVDIPREVTDILRDTILGLWGVGWDALSALEAYRSGMPATQHLGIGDLDEVTHDDFDQPYIFHFPGGNAGVARSLVRRLLPAAVPGSGMENLVTARVDYSLLDRRDSGTRIRLNSTAVDLRHTADGKQVDVTYVQSGDVHRVRGRHVVFAGYNAMLPYICAEVPARQQEAIKYAEKVPLVYISIAVRNWRPFAELGYSNFYIPQSKYMYGFGMDFPVSMGDYHYTTNPDEPTVIHGSWVPHAPDKGLSAREQYTAGRRQLYALTFDDFESDIVAKMSGALAPGGFDAERDIAAITVNRWPHGYAYEYNDLSDPPGFSPDNGPHVAGRAQIGRISIANSDAAAFAYVNGAVDAADRAVNEQLVVS